MKSYKCIKSLYKSTYKANAFTKNSIYPMARENRDIIWIVDKTGREFSFCKEKDSTMYFIDDYFVKL